MKEANMRYLMFGLCFITVMICSAWVFTPTDFTFDLSMDNNTVEFAEAMAEINKYQDSECLTANNFRCQLNNEKDGCFYIIN